MSFPGFANKGQPLFFSVSMIIIMILLTELNCFYLKFVMWAQPDHPYVLGRLCFMACMGAVALRLV